MKSVKLTEQQKKVIDCLLHPKGTTIRHLLTFEWINSPTKRISELVAIGYPIIKEWVKTENSRYLVYRLGEVSDAIA